jgi:LmbE family N-acetylglucosaminyl deacetylase
VTFDHRQRGTPEHDWARSEELAQLRPLALPPAGTRLIVLAAHPDDETLGAGGLIAMAAQQQRRIEVVIATDGEASHPASTTHTRSLLAIIRRHEAAAAVAALAPDATVTFLGLPDGRLGDFQGALSRALRIRVDRARPVWLATPWRADRHPDHEICAVVAESLADDRPDVRLLEYPVWFWQWAAPGSGGLAWSDFRRLELTDTAVAAKSGALRWYRSQCEPLSDEIGDEAILPPQTAAHFLRRFETFEVNGSSAAAPGYFDDL